MYGLEKASRINIRQLAYPCVMRWDVAYPFHRAVRATAVILVWYGYLLMNRRLRGLISVSSAHMDPHKEQLTISREQHLASDRSCSHRCGSLAT